MPDSKYKHLQFMTNETGIIQFSQGRQPDPASGYTLDDNARSLMVALMIEDQTLASIYARNLTQAQQSDGSWSNLLIKGQYTAQFDSEDSIGRALLACSLGMHSELPGIAETCQSLFENQWPKTSRFRSPRAIGYALLALIKGPSQLLKDNNKWQQFHQLSQFLLALYHQVRRPQWYWFEDRLTYCNGILSQALWAASQVNSERVLRHCAQESLQFLNSLQFRTGQLSVIGNHGWYLREKHERIPLYDQQPVEAASMAFACYEAYLATGSPQYMQLFQLARQWFYGQNINNQIMIDPESGGCYDGLTPHGPNLNQGAESLLSYLLTDLLWERKCTASSEMVRAAN